MFDSPTRRHIFNQTINDIKGIAFQPYLSMPSLNSELKPNVGCIFLRKVVFLDTLRECHCWDEPTIVIMCKSPTTCRPKVPLSCLININFNPPSGRCNPNNIWSSFLSLDSRFRDVPVDMLSINDFPIQCRSRNRRMKLMRRAKGHNFFLNGILDKTSIKERCGLFIPKNMVVLFLPNTPRNVWELETTQNHKGGVANSAPPL